MSLGHLSSLDSLTLLGCRQLQESRTEATAAPLERLKVPRLELLSVSTASSADLLRDLRISCMMAAAVFSCVDQSSIKYLRVGSFHLLREITVLRASQLQQLDISGGPDLTDDHFNLLLQHQSLRKVSLPGVAMLQDHWHTPCRWEELCLTGGNLTLQQLAAFPLPGILRCVVKLEMLVSMAGSYALERILQCVHRLAFEPGIMGPYSHDWSWMTDAVCQVSSVEIDPLPLGVLITACSFCWLEGRPGPG